MPKFAQRIYDMESSAKIIRALFGAMDSPNIISLGGGAPASDALPVEAVHDICTDVITRNKRGVEALQYGSVLGVSDLRKNVADILLKPKGLEAELDEIIIVNGGLETMNLLCQVYINPGDVILVESPTFVHCVEIFEMFQARCVGVECDDCGMILEDVEKKIQKLHPKLVYIIPTFQNPTGKTFPLERRKKLAEIGSKYDVIILEDDPYQELRYSGEPLPPIKCFDKTGHTVYANSFSKIFSPGSRLGFCHASHDIITKLFDAKSATNSHTSTFAQVVCAEFFNRGLFSSQLKKLCEIHRERRDVMMNCFAKYMPDGTKWVHPDGGLFSWVELPGGIDTAALLPEANAAGIHYIAGSSFYVQGGNMGSNAMRVSFGNVTPEKIDIAVQQLASLVKNKL